MGLNGKYIVVTRAADQLAGFKNALEQSGAKVLPFPVIQITGPENEDLCREMINDVTAYNWIIFSSANAVRYFFRLGYELHSQKTPVKIACVGDRTARVLEQNGITADLIPEDYTARSLLATLNQTDLMDQRILIPVSDLAGDELQRGLTGAGAKVRPVVVYRNQPFVNPESDELMAQIRKGLIDCITFFSPSALHAFIDQMDGEVVVWINRSGIAVAVIGPTTAAAVRSSGITSVIVPEVKDGAHLIRAIENYYV